MKAYVFQAALHCETCAARLESANRHRLPPGANLDDESTYDSDQFPKGPYPNGGGEADSPQHCDSCGEFLENTLTPDGDSWLRAEIVRKVTPPGTRELSWSETAALADEVGEPVLAMWIRFYFAEGM